MRVFMVERNLLPVQKGKERTMRKTSALYRNVFSRTCILFLKTTDNGQKRFVKSMNSEHNHEINKVRQYCNSLCR